MVKRSVACKKYSEGKITRQTSVMPIPDTPVQKSVMGSAINKPSKAVIFELDSMMITSLGSSPHARGMPIRRLKFDAGGGFIPACAGNTRNADNTCTEFL